MFRREARLKINSNPSESHMDKTANGEGEEKVGRGLESPRTALLKGDF